MIFTCRLYAFYKSNIIHYKIIKLAGIYNCYIYMYINIQGISNIGLFWSVDVLFKSKRLWGGISAVTMNQNKPNSKSKIPTKYSVHFY